MKKFKVKFLIKTLSKAHFPAIVQFELCDRYGNTRTEINTIDKFKIYYREWNVVAIGTRDNESTAIYYIKESK